MTKYDGLYADVAHVGDYFSVWAVYEEMFMAAVSRIRSMDIRAHIDDTRSVAEDELKTEDASSRFSEPLRTVPGGIVIIDLVGPLMKAESSLSGGTSTVLVRRQIRRAAASEDVHGILLRIDSPGGTVAGTDDLAVDILAAGREKPVHAIAEDLTASAAFWLACQAARITVTRTSLVGSIGTFAVVMDSSKAHKDAGFVVHVIKAGKFKGAGTEGTKFTADQESEMQRIINGLNEHFINAVAAGRSLSMTRARELADGRVHVGQAAVDEGLADAVGTIDTAIAQLREEIGQADATRGQTMETSTMDTEKKVEESSAATTTAEDKVESAVTPTAGVGLAELESACIGADSDFLIAQLRKPGNTVAAATQEWMTTLNTRLEAQSKELATTKTRVGAASTAGGYGPTAGSEGGSSEYGSAQEEWNVAIEAEMKKGRDRSKAAMMVNKHKPELRARMLEDVNAARGRPMPVLTSVPF